MPSLKVWNIGSYNYAVLQSAATSKRRWFLKSPGMVSMKYLLGFGSSVHSTHLRERMMGKIWYIT